MLLVSPATSKLVLSGVICEGSYEGGSRQLIPPANICLFRGYGVSALNVTLAIVEPRAKPKPYGTREPIYLSVSHQADPILSLSALG